MFAATDQPDAVVHGANADGDHADVLPLRRAVLGRESAEWLAVLNRLDPLTYAVEPMRRAIFAHLNVSPAQPARRWTQASPGGAGACRPLLEAAVIAVLGLVDAAHRDMGVLPSGVDVLAPPGDAPLRRRRRGWDPARLSRCPTRDRRRQPPTVGQAHRVARRELRRTRRSTSGCSMPRKASIGADPARRPHDAPSGARCRARLRRSRLTAGRGCA